MRERLYRSVDDRMIAGVCGGIAARLDIDPSIVRVVWALLVFPTGLVALAAYVVMWLVVPQGTRGRRDRRSVRDPPSLRRHRCGTPVRGWRAHPRRCLVPAA